MTRTGSSDFEDHAVCKQEATPKVAQANQGPYEEKRDENSGMRKRNHANVELVVLRHAVEAALTTNDACAAEAIRRDSAALVVVHVLLEMTVRVSNIMHSF